MIMVRGSPHQGAQTETALSSMATTVENQPWYPQWRQAVQRLILARERLRDTKAGTEARIEAEREYEAAWSGYKIIADQV
jgi:hypothetical protein